jgi:uncharacterized protein YPO0396
MKNLTRIRLINWHLFENATITCQGTTYFIGVNGAGKSTILDAIQFALVGGQRDVKFNQAALSGGKRTLAAYVRGELGTEAQRYLRGDTTGVVALEFCNPDGTFFVHGGVIDAYEDGRSPDTTYFIVHNAPLDDAWFFKSAAQLYDTRAFKRHLEHFALPPESRAQVFTRLEDYRFHLLNRLGQLKDSFLGKIVKGVAFSPLTDIRSFVHNYLLDENLVDVKTLQAQLETLRHFEGLAADVRERITYLDQIEELDKERVANRRRRITNGYIQRRAQGDTHLTSLKTRRLELDEARLALNRAELERDSLAERLQHAQAALLDSQVALQTNQVAAREKELRDKLAALETQLADLRQREAEINRALSQEISGAQRLRDLLLADQQTVPPQLDALIELPVSQQSPIRDLQTTISNLQSPLATLSQRFGSEATLVDERARQLRLEAEGLEREIRQLRTGDREASYQSDAPQAVRLQRLLRAQLGLGPDDVVFLSAVLQVPDESWQDAVEGALGRNRFTLLVPAAYYAAAVQIYRDRRHKDGLHGVGLLDTERLLANRPHKSNSKTLAAEVETDHPAARAFVDLLLGHIAKCDSLEALREHRTAVTREAFLRRNYTTTHLNPQVYKRWFIGRRAIPRQVEQRQARLEEIAREMVALNQRSSELLERLALTREKIRPLLNLEHALPELARLPVLEEEREACRVELAALDTQAINRLQAEVEHRQGEVNRLFGENAGLERRVGGLENRVQTLTEETIPALELAVDQVLQGARQFLALETGEEDNLEDALAEMEKEYERRRERQPLETVLQNSTRYENDYQSAEMRSRDQLREAKQAYSLRYDFGYDDDENAARYLAERDKLVQSDLPQYEARIEDQRARAEQELVENFIHRLREQIEEARQQLAYLNATLVHLQFGGERFEFVTQPAPALREVYDMVMDSHNILGDSLFESNFRQKHQKGWDLLFEHLTASGPDAEEALGLEMRQLQDYRNYLEYDIRIHYPNGDRALLSKINAKKSGGETTTPFYVAMAASFAQAYRLNQPRPSDTIRLAMFDEAFGKMDTARTASALRFMRETGLQVLLATPPDKSGALLEFVDCVRTVVRKNNHAFVIEIDKAEMLKELESDSEFA